jgi:hypothetical protein
MIKIRMSDSDLPDGFLFLFVRRWLLELSHLQKALSILALCIMALVGIVPFLVALETLHPSSPLASQHLIL